MVNKHIAFLLILCCACPLWAGESPPEPERAAETTIEHGAVALDAALALGEMVFSSYLIYGVNVMFGSGFANVTPESIRHNLKFSSWGWESYDRFTCNQLLHPYQGSLSFNAARSLGFGFYSSLAFNMAGSWVWETFYENASPSTNDFITTSVGGSILGEMLHRVFLDLNEKPGFGWDVLTAAISPTDKVNSLFTRKNRLRRGQSRLRQFVKYSAW
jgi:hypothetical protein